jgi:hypothetical protein
MLIAEGLLNTIYVVVPSPPRYQGDLQVSSDELGTRWSQSRGKLPS